VSDCVDKLYAKGENVLRYVHVASLDRDSYAINIFLVLGPTL